MPTFTHGKSTAFKLDNAAGTITDISNTLTDVSFPQTVETAETTSFGSSAKTYVVGLSDSTISLSGNFDTTVDAHIAGVLGQAATLSFEYYPQGTTTGNVKYSGEAILTSYEKSGAVGDVVTFSAELQVTGAVTRATA
ncbi:Phage major tail protein TP901-1 [uncultured Caudovirales phage]|uniref:Phage major tail protein TP901-1 n=1 Tax=uncultured Caudovirales phage TaxID=2100421 RepID=A0A6J5NH73_9CAUD|nr:Phage major tail protein TP901-1 [uncultured Caudovirales phage]